VLPAQGCRTLQGAVMDKEQWWNDYLQRETEYTRNIKQIIKILN
jgi:hypothetical protein